MGFLECGKRGMSGHLRAALELHLNDTRGVVDFVYPTWEGVLISGQVIALGL